MPSDAPDSFLNKSLEPLLFLLLITATAVNLSANLIADVTLLHTPHENPKGLLRLLIIISKPMIVPALAGILFLRTRGAASTIRRGAFFVALFFCWVGDISLLITKPGYFFFIGLGSFGVAHVFFIRSYLLLDEKVHQWKSVAYGLPFIVYGYTLYSIIYHQLTHQQPPPPPPEQQAALMKALAIAGYMVLLLSNGVTGFLRLRVRNSPSSGSILVGIVLFVQSDSIIAVTEFVNTMPLERFAIMATYILGVYLMVRGCILDSEECSKQPAAQPAAPSKPQALAA